MPRSADLERHPIGRWTLLPALILSLALAPCPHARADQEGGGSNLAPTALPNSGGTLLDQILERARQLAQRLRKPHPTYLTQTDTIRILSWNIQTFGNRTQPGRVRAHQAFLSNVCSENSSVHILACQEIAHERSARRFLNLLPRKPRSWELHFQDTTDSQDNAFLTDSEVRVNCDRLLTSSPPRAGRIHPATNLSRHPARVAHMRTGDLDFTILTLHLAYSKGSPEAPRRELDHILKWIQAYFSKPQADPDMILAGDFNLPTLTGKALSRRAHERNWPALEEILEEKYHPPSKGAELVALVDAPTSRDRGRPANNYDHFILSRNLFDKAYVPSSAGPIPPEYIHKAESQMGVQTSDHYPIWAAFRRRGPTPKGEAIEPDGAAACRVIDSLLYFQ